MTKHIPGRWAPICQDCFDLGCKTDFFPDTMSYGDCIVCDAEGVLIANVHPEIARAAVVEYEAVVARGQAAIR